MLSSPDNMLGYTLQYFRALSTLKMMDKIFISKDRSCYLVSCTAITRFISIRIWDCPCVEKKKTRYATAMQFFDVVLVCISLPISQVLRGSSYFSIVLFLNRVSLDCNIKRMHSTF